MKVTITILFALMCVSGCSLFVDQPSKPSSVQVEHDPGPIVFLNWEYGFQNPTVEGFEIRRKNLSSDLSYVSLTKVGASSRGYTDNIVAAGHTYSYVVGAFNAAGVTWSETVDVVLPAAGGSSEPQLQFADEFNQSGLNTTVWNYDIGTGPPYPGWGNSELQYYTNRRQNLYFEEIEAGNSALVIEAREESYGGMPYTSARINTKGKFDFTYGRVEARMKLPEGRGIWPAFWMLGADIDQVGWPASGEIDIMEIVGHEPGVLHGTIHFGNPWPNNSNSGGSYTLAGGGKFSEGYHIFAIEWEPGEIRWYIDDLLYSKKTDADWFVPNEPDPAPFNNDFYLLLNIAVGGNWPGSPDASTQFPQKMYVDYVRVFELDN